MSAAPRCNVPVLYTVTGPGLSARFIYCGESVIAADKPIAAAVLGLNLADVTAFAARRGASVQPANGWRARRAAISQQLSRVRLLTRR
jgi:hypothetical protein